MVVSLSTEGSSTVERTSQVTTDRVVGIVTTYDDSSVTLSSEDTNILVESEGEVLAYVSDMNGEVSQGDPLVISPLKGILMKGSQDSTGTVLAVAAESLASATQVSDYRLDDSDKSTKISKLKVNLNQQGTSNGQTAASSAIAKLGKSVVGKEVSEVRVLVALLIFIIVLIAEGGIIYGAVSSAITALGRNPLARKIIRREMIQVLAVALLVLVLGLGAVYGILWV
jgi:hypothetical protein